MFRVVAVCHPAFRYVHGNGIQNTAVSILAPVEITVAVVSISPASVKGLCGKGMGLQDSGIEGPGLPPRKVDSLWASRIYGVQGFGLRFLCRHSSFSMPVEESRFLCPMFVLFDVEGFCSVTVCVT